MNLGTIASSLAPLLTFFVLAVGGGCSAKLPYDANGLFPRGEALAVFTYESGRVIGRAPATQRSSLSEYLREWISSHSESWQSSSVMYVPELFIQSRKTSLNITSRRVVLNSSVEGGKPEYYRYLSDAEWRELTTAVITRVPDIEKQ
jgi:hypothetical protein